MLSEQHLAEAAARLVNEQLAPISQLARLVPASRAGKKDGQRGTRGHVASWTLLRWITRGTPEGAFLDGTIGPGGGWLSSKEALARFFAARSVRLLAGSLTVTNPTSLERDAQAAAAELAALRNG